MEIGLFICDHINAPGGYAQMFESLFPEYQFEHYYAVNNEFPEDIGKCDAYMVTGSKYSVYDSFAWIATLKKLVREIYNREIPFVGLCFGHQILGEALGGEVNRSSFGWRVGVHEFHVIQKEKWMTPDMDKLNLFMMCQDQIVQLPKGAVVLATNQRSPNAMIRVGSKVLGIQAHPEFSETYSRRLINSRFDMLGADTVKESLESLNIETHNHIVKSWISNFLESNV